MPHGHRQLKRKLLAIYLDVNNIFYFSTGLVVLKKIRLSDGRYIWLCMRKVNSRQ